MVCELKIKELERKLNRKLTDAEKKKVKEKLGHVEMENHTHDREELMVYA